MTTTDYKISDGIKLVSGRITAAELLMEQAGPDFELSADGQRLIRFYKSIRIMLGHLNRLHPRDRVNAAQMLYHTARFVCLCEDLYEEDPD